MSANYFILKNADNIQKLSPEKSNEHCVIKALLEYIDQADKRIEKLERMHKSLIAGHDNIK